MTAQVFDFQIIKFKLCQLNESFPTPKSKHEMQFMLTMQLLYSENNHRKAPKQDPAFEILKAAFVTLGGLILGTTGEI